MFSLRGLKLALLLCHEMSALGKPTFDTGEQVVHATRHLHVATVEASSHLGDVAI